MYDRDPKRPGTAGGAWNDLLYTHTDMPAADLKGIGYAYRIYNFSTRRNLKILWHRALAENLIKPVLAVFPAELRIKLRTLAEEQAAEEDVGH